jgi:predicted RND superfamily exporter protein
MFRLALTMAKTGPSITLTSLTDFFAFLVGSNTSLPALSKFSVYCAVGILFDFALQVSSITVITQH